MSEELLENAFDKGKQIDAQLDYLDKLQDEQLDEKLKEAHFTNKIIKSYQEEHVDNDGEHTDEHVDGELLDDNELLDIPDELEPVEDVGEQEHVDDDAQHTPVDNECEDSVETNDVQHTPVDTEAQHASEQDAVNEPVDTEAQPTKLEDIANTTGLTVQTSHKHKHHTPKPSEVIQPPQESAKVYRKRGPKPKSSHYKHHTHVEQPPQQHEAIETFDTRTINTRVNGKQMQAEISVSNSHKSEEQINAEANSHKDKVMREIREQVEELERNDQSLKVNTSDYLSATDEQHTEDKCARYLYYILGKFLLPDTIVNNLPAIEYINSITTFKYNPYDSPNVALQHSIPENVLTIHKLNKIFETELIPVMIDNYHFDDVDEKICLFLEKFKTLPSTNLEYEMIRSFLAKLIYSLSTSTEMALREKKVSHVDPKYKKAILHDLDIMSSVQFTKGKWMLSWSKFIESFFGYDGDNLVYDFKSYEKLNSEVKTSYEEDFLMEILLANILKTYFPSISINYFYVIKSVYLTARLLTVYIDHLKQKVHKLGQIPNVEDIVNDINIIAHAGVMLYEIKNYTFKQMSRSLPSCKNGMSNETEMYILNHIFTGGQYYLLKMLERSLPVLGSYIRGQLEC